MLVDDLIEIGGRIAAARKKLKLAQRTVAEQAGVSLKTVNLLENGYATEIGLGKLTRILAAVGLELQLAAVRQERPTLDDLLSEDAAND